jgi:chitodextrinase
MICPIGYLKGVRRCEVTARTAFNSIVRSLLRVSMVLALVALSASHGFAQLPNTGAQKTIVIVVNFQDNPTFQPWSTAAIQNFYFGSGAGTVNGFFQENSYGQVSIAGDVAGYYTVPLSGATASGTDIVNAANAAATAAGYTLSQYGLVIYMCASTVNSSCDPNGGAEVGYSPGQTQYSWFAGGILNLRIAVHEIGHLFGLLHSNGLNGAMSLSDPNTVIPSPLNGTQPYFMQYGDYYDVMGSGFTTSGSGYSMSSTAMHYNSYQKERLGWLGAGASPAITMVTQSGTYYLEPYETVSAGGAKALKILREHDSVNANNMSYYVECRRKLGAFDSAALSAIGYAQDVNNVLDGVLVHLGIDKNWDYYPYGKQPNVFSLDMTPGSQPLGTPIGFGNDPADPALVVGKSLFDAGAGITISTASAADTGCSVNVVMTAPAAPGVRRQPTVKVSPTNGASPVASGTTVNYTVTVTNNDDASLGPSTFVLAASNAWWGPYLSPGWTMTFNASQLTIAPGSSGTTTLAVTSASNANANQSDMVNVSAVNLQSPYFVDIGPSTYACTGPAGSDTTPPTVSITAPTNGATVTGIINVSASASDTQTWVTKVEFYLDGTLIGSSPYGGILFYSAGYSNGAHSMFAKAYDAVGNVGVSSTINFTISNSNTAPITVAITSPTNGAVVSGSITLSATASSNVKYINYYLTPVGSYGAGFIGSISNSPYNFVLDTTKYGNGSTALYAVAFDSLGDQGISATINFTINNNGVDVSPPSVPTGLTAKALSSSQVSLNWSASTDNVGVAGYKIYRNTVLINTTSVTSFTDSGLLPLTTYSYTVAAYDAAGNLSAQSSLANVTTPPPDTTAPTVSITSPKTGGTVAAKSSVVITATASDNIGVTKVQFYVNGALTCTSTTSPYSCASWNVAAGKNQKYQLQAMAYDAAGNVGVSAIVSVTSK